MSTEYFPTRYLAWDEVTKAALPEPLQWCASPSNCAHSQCLTDGCWFLHARRTRPLIGEVVNGTYFERYGGNDPTFILQKLGEVFNCLFVDEQGASLTKEGEQNWNNDDALIAASAARGRKIP